MLGDNQKLFRWRCRAATYANWPVLRYMLQGNTVSDAPLIIGSLDPCYSCTDRGNACRCEKRKSKKQFLIKKLNVIASNVKFAAQVRD